MIYWSQGTVTRRDVTSTKTQCDEESVFQNEKTPAEGEG